MAEPVVSSVRPSRLWRVVLVVSLALNLAVVGLVAGAALSGRWKDGPPRGFELSLGPVAKALNREQRESIRGRLRGDRSLRPITPREARADQEALLEVLRAEAYDPLALEALLGKQQGRMRDVQSAAQQALTAQIDAMSVQERADFADRLEQEFSKRPPRD